MFDVFISGAGPVGLYLSYSLSQAGHSVFICDKKSGPAVGQSRAMAITARTLETFENRGIAPAFMERAGLIVRGVNIYSDGVKVGTVDLNQADTPYPHITSIGQDQTELFLVEKLHTETETRVHWNTACLGYSQSDDGVEVRIQNEDQTEEIIRAKYIVGADGTHSVVRHGTDGWTFDGRSVETKFALADVVLEGKDMDDTLTNGENRTYMFYSGAQLLGCIPFARQKDGSKRYRLFANLGSFKVDESKQRRVNHGFDAQEKLTLEEMNRILDKLTGNLEIKAVDPTWLNIFHINERKANGYRRNRAFVAGDAAHCHSPLGGQGLNTGVQDADNLAWKLSLVLKGKASDPEKLLDSYSLEREPIAAEVLQATGKITEMMMSDNIVSNTVRTVALRATVYFDFMKANLFEAMLQTALQIDPESPIVFPRPKNARALPDPGMMLKETSALTRRAIIDKHTMDRRSIRQVLHPFTRQNKHVALLVTTRLGSQRASPWPQPFFQARLPEACGRVIIEPSFAATSYTVPEYAEGTEGAEDVFWIENHGRLSNDAYTLSKRIGLTDCLTAEEEPPAALLLVRPDLYIAHSCFIRTQDDLDKAIGLLYTYLK
ncbi:FAD binding domain-domain-containing protein [Syncephalastrum racemosum]|uniref:FAD binding domain-domain-containing protein n=1 Tax=Syncephalastrum racemosum TaxID=13706 RepID=A0A1X2HLM7_SYNRA|nr:FAD binding domain-domain-containing protein [Syncephalastrum racemosum]